MAAAAVGIASTLPAQPATLRGSEVSKAIGEDFMKNIAKAAEESLEHSDSNNELTTVGDVHDSFEWPIPPPCSPLVAAGRW